LPPFTFEGVFCLLFRFSPSLLVLLTGKGFREIGKIVKFFENSLRPAIPRKLFFGYA